MGFYSREHYRRVSPPRDTEREVRLRLIDQECAAKAHSDADERFGRIPPSDADQIIEKHKYWLKRLAFWRDALGAWG